MKDHGLLRGQLSYLSDLRTKIHFAKFTISLGKMKAGGCADFRSILLVKETKVIPKLEPRLMADGVAGIKSISNGLEAMIWIGPPCAQNAR